MNLGEWIKRMTIVINMSDNQITNATRNVKTNCIYSNVNFCSGKKTTAKFKDKEPCKYFKDGKCECKLFFGGKINDEKR